jgi:hypothetical protein
MDYKQAQFTALNAAGKGTYTQLKNMILEPSEIAKQMIDGEADGKWSRLFGEGKTADEKKMLAFKAANEITVLMHELAIGLVKPTMVNAEKLWNERNPPKSPPPPPEDNKTEEGGGMIDYFSSKIPFFN